MKRASKLVAVCLALLMCLTAGVTAACKPDGPSGGNTYTVTLPTGLTGGSVTADKKEVEEGGSVVITAAPDESYELDWIKINGEDQAKTGNNRYEVKNVKENITVTAAFKRSEVPSMFLAFPDDRLINSASDLTYYVNESGEQEYRSDLPALEAGAELGIMVTMKAGALDEQLEFFPDSPDYAISGGVKTNYSENGFEKGILTDVTDGIYMKPSCAYEIAYTASKAGRTETRIQTVLVANTYDLVSDLYGSTYDDAVIMNMELVDAPSAIYGEDKVMKLNLPEDTAEKSGMFEKAGIYLGTKLTSDFHWLIYNDSDTEVILAVKGVSNVMDPKLAPHSYMLWNPYTRPYYQSGGSMPDGSNPIFDTHGYIDSATGALKTLQFTCVPTDMSKEVNIYIGGLRGTAVPYTEFATFPEDRVISSAEMGDPYGITYYVNESGDQEFRSDFPTAKNASTEITAKATARNFRAAPYFNDLTPPTGIAADQFSQGVLDDISDGIDMLPGYAYYIEYTAKTADGATETRTQTIILWDMAPFVPDIYTGASFRLVNEAESVTVEEPDSALMGSRMLNIKFGDHSAHLDARRQVWWTKSGVKVAGDRATQRLEFLIYNPNDFAMSMFNVIGVNSSWGYITMEPHTYLLWDPYSLSGWSEALWGDGSARQDGLITEANELGSIGFYFDAAEGKAGSLYVGQFMATLPAAEAAA